MNKLWRKFLAWLKKKFSKKDEATQTHDPVEPTPAEPQECNCPSRVIDPPSWLFGPEGTNEETPHGNYPDIRYLVGKLSEKNKWKFFGKFAKDRMATFDGKNVTGKCECVDGVYIHCAGQRQGKEANPLLTERTVGYKACHRCYYECRQ